VVGRRSAAGTALITVTPVALAVSGMP
jgi:hypothetical protein